MVVRPRLISALVLATVLLQISTAESATKITAVTASKHQEGNPPAHVLDGDTKTRYSQRGKGEWLQLRFSRAVALESLQVGFASGFRTYKFELLFSDDGKKWSSPLALASSGKGDKPELFKFAKTKCQYLRLVNQGSNSNDWINVHTLRIDGIEGATNVAAKSTKPTKSKTKSKSRSPAKPGDITVSEFATTGSVGSPIGISVDNQGRVYVTETRRRKRATPDVRRLSGFMLDAMESQRVEDKSAAIRKHRKDWKAITEKYKEVIWQLVDEDGDGKFDKRSAFYEGFNEDVSGVAAGVLCVDDDVYVTCIPSLYRLRDKDQDGKADEVTELVRGMGIHIGFAGHNLHGPTLGVDGRIYWSMGDKGFRVIRKEDGRDFFYPGHGAVFRAEQDGTGFEVFAAGCRNPEELAFDEFGNWFTADNDGDMGDRERLHFLVEGIDVGWRAFYQYRGRNYNPWLADRLWQLKNDRQPAYLSPPFDYTASGPIGFVYNPGTALSKKYHRHFFLANSSKSTVAFQLEPAGAGFKRINRHTVMSRTFATGLSFGPDGALYAADWGNNGWQPHQRGRVLKLDAQPESLSGPRQETQRLLREGITKRSAKKLAGLLAHADRRIRMSAQFELVKRDEAAILAQSSAANNSKEAATKLLARLHAIWGLGQLGRKNRATVKPVIALLGDAHPEIRAQAAKVIGEAKSTEAADAVAKLLADKEPRVRLMAGVALRHLGKPEHLPLAVKLLEENDDQDDFLRHAGVMALTGIGSKSAGVVVGLKSHPSSAVRAAAVVALRRLKSSQVAVFLSDTDPRVSAEAARAIHDDLSITAALPKLAERLTSSVGANEPLGRRAISANRRLADVDSAVRLARFAANKSESEALRIVAINTLAGWTKSQRLDDIQGHPRGISSADQKLAHAALDRVIGALLGSSSKSIQTATTKAIAALEYGDATQRVTQLAMDKTQDVRIRGSSLEAMKALKAPRLDEALSAAIKDPHDALRATALRVLSQHAPADKKTLDAAKKALGSSSLLERQTAFAALARLDSAGAGQLLLSQLKDLKSLSPEVRLDAVLAGEASKDKGVKAQAEAIKKQLADKPLGLFALASAGGDPKEGRLFFQTSTVARCAQCHRLGGNQNSIGPDLAKIAVKRGHNYLLRAIVQPSADIDAKYRVKQFILASGKTVSGTIVSETDKEYVVAQSADKITRIAKQDVEEQIEQKVSIMPDITKNLTLRQVRDLLAFLKTLK
jgi:quinoprotein glucose dehydrogenase